ncbi:MAG: hypothetical protein Q8N03_04045 [Ignavibacteria bacterium]|nr:hypothetical protein [Ignavibacteria bacterium]
MIQNKSFRKFSKLITIVLFLLMGQSNLFAQFDVKWMSVGSLHNWFSAIGSEIEEGFVKRQQYGMQWPAIYDYQNIQAWKAMWIGTKDFTDEQGRFFPVKVVHVGPRVSGGGEFFPIKHAMKSKSEKPVVFVDGSLSEGKSVDVDEIDPTMQWDREIETIVNSQLGITMTRRVFQFSQQYHDNYIVNEYTFKNTGNVNGDSDIELPTQNLKDVVFFFQWRLAPCEQTRYVIGNPTGWGMNTTYDTRGDGKLVDPPNEQFRAQFAWHGRYPSFTQYDNLGGPIWNSALYVPATDTSGRLGAPQFAGIVTVHADKSASDKTDDPGQPSTTKTFDSDGPLQSGNDAFNAGKMADEYAFINAGNENRHMTKIGETNPIQPTKDPAVGTNGGFSAGNGYGPYNLGPGDSIRIVMVEAVAGISRERAIEVGRKYKADKDALSKNTAFFTGRDSLFQTFRRIQNAFQNNWNFEKSPLPPQELYVDGLGDRISLKWKPYNDADPDITGYRVYRAIGSVDSTYNMIADLPVSARSYNDTEVPRGVNCYYFLQSVGKPITADPTLNIPAGNLVSSRYYTQTFDPTFLKKEASLNLDNVRIVPNPLNLASDPNNLRFPERSDRMFFFNLPGNANIKIYTEYGELIKTIEHTNGSGDEYWDCTTSSNQVIVSGIYIAVVKDNNTGDQKILKFVVIR